MFEFLTTLIELPLAQNGPTSGDIAMRTGIGAAVGAIGMFILLLIWRAINGQKK